MMQGGPLHLGVYLLAYMILHYLGHSMVCLTYFNNSLSFIKNPKAVWKMTTVTLANNNKISGAKPTWQVSIYLLTYR